jgi:hypothetical protein
LNLNGTSQTDSGSVLLLAFSQAIAGVGLHTLTGGRFNYQTASVQGGEEEYNGVTLSNVRVQSASAPDPASVFPTTGLQQWLRVEKTDGTRGGPYSVIWGGPVRARP